MYTAPITRKASRKTMVCSGPGLASRARGKARARVRARVMARVRARARARARAKARASVRARALHLHRVVRVRVVGGERDAAHRA